MAKVLFVLPIGMDMGGIITSSREVVAGLKAAGHETQFVTAHFGKVDRGVGQAARGKYADEFVWDDATEAMFHPMLGWREEPRFTLTTDSGLARFLAHAKKYDIVIWGALFPFADADASYWLQAFAGHKAKQIIMIHDDHLTERYPWALGLAKYTNVALGMFQAAYDSLEPIACDRALVYNPIAPPPKSLVPVKQRSGFLSMQVWKPWKNADKLVAAAPLIKKIGVSFAGDGIQLRYIRSQDKCPPKFQGLWSMAMSGRGNNYLGVVDEALRTKYLQSHRFLVDLSYRPGNTGQINTMVQQAMAQGCVVIANPNFLGKSPFKPGIDYVPITEDQYGPEDLARELKRIYGEIDGDRYTKIQRSAWTKLGLFDRKRIGQQIVDEAMTGIRGRPNKAARDAFFLQFGMEV